MGESMSRLHRIARIAGIAGLILSVGLITGAPPAHAAAGTVQLSSSTYTVNEAAGAVTVDIIRVGGSDGALSVDVTSADGTATGGDDYNGLATPLTFNWPDGDTATKSVTFPILPDTLAETNETFTVTFAATNPDWVGTPSTATVTITDDPPGTIQFALADYVVNEAAGAVTVAMNRVGGDQGALSVDVTSADGTATGGDDYNGLATPLTFNWPDGDTATKSVTFPILPDTLAETNETFTVTFAATNPDWVGTPSTATVTITDDPPGTIQFALADYVVNEAAGAVTVAMNRVGGDQGALSVDVTSADGTATGGDDYNGLATPLTFNWPDGDTATKSVTFPILPDTLAETNETFTVTFAATNPDWVGTPSTATVTITDDPPGTIQFALADYVVNEAAGSVTVALDRVGGDQGALSVDVTSANGTATGGDDYNGLATPLTFNWPDGDTATKSVTFPILPDTLAETNETFTVTFAATNPDWVGTPSTATVTIQGDSAQISVTKTALGGDASFAFTTTGTGYLPFALSNAKTDVSAILTPGAYSFSETPMPGWRLDSITCSKGTVAGTHVDFALVAGDVVNCAVVNEKLATVQVTKSVTGTWPAAGVDFTISSVGGTFTGPATQATDSALSSATWTDVIPGETYTITETPQTGYAAGALTCNVTDTDGTADLSVTFVATAGAAVACSSSSDQIVAVTTSTVAVTTSTVPATTPTTTMSGILPATGSASTSSALGVGAALLALGFVLLAVRRSPSRSVR